MTGLVEPYVPAPEESGQLARVFDFIAAHERTGRGDVPPRYFLAGAEPGERVELPPHVYEALRHIVESMSQGLAVTVAPMTALLTTQQAADLLGVSRPTVIRLMTGGRLPFQLVGTHRKVTLQDVLAYRRRRREEQYAALEATAADYDVDEQAATAALAQMRKARRAIAARRRGESS